LSSEFYFIQAVNDMPLDISKMPEDFSSIFMFEFFFVYLSFKIQAIATLPNFYSSPHHLLSFPDCPSLTPDAPLPLPPF